MLSMARGRNAAFGVGILFAFSMLACPGAAVARPKLTTLYEFCSKKRNCSDGEEPISNVALDANGNAFGTTTGGGAHGNGTIYEVMPDKTHLILYDFCAKTSCTDGADPGGGVVRDKLGNLYGTTYEGGAAGQGLIYELARPKNGKPWKLKVLYDFCVTAGCPDGGNPFDTLTYQGAQAGLTYDGSSPLYGMTVTGGAANSGVAFELKTPRSAPVVVEMKSFCSQPNCSDGAFPRGSLTMDASGNLYGATGQGGDATSQMGVVFELSPQGDGFDETVLYSFCPASGCMDGASPNGATIDGSGNLVGTTGRGGPSDEGTIFKIVPNGTSSQESVLYDFCSTDQCLDGGLPNAGLTVDSKGDLFGTTTMGGTSFENGTVFEFRGTKETVLHDFCSAKNCRDGGGPFGVLVLDDAGNLYGTTSSGGGNGVGGTLFELTP